MKITKAQAAKEQKARKRNLTKYIPNAAQAIFTARPLNSPHHVPHSLDLSGV